MDPDASRSGWRPLKRSFVRAIAVGALSLACAGVHGQGASEPAVPAVPVKPKVYALVAAVGTTFHVAVEKRSTGSHLNPYRRKAIDAPGNVLNLVVLQALDKEIAKVRPDGQRIYFSLPAAGMDGVSAGERDDVAIAKVVEELRKMPQRADWERIVVATPAYKAFGMDGIADKLQGLGISMHPLASDQLSMFFDQPFNVDSLHGAEVMTPDGKTARTHVYLAPYSYLAIWVLDPGTLAVLDKQVRLDNQKLADPRSGTFDLVEGVGKEFVARQIVNLIGRSVHEAVAHTELAGRADVHDVREVKPAKPGNEPGAALSAGRWLDPRSRGTLDSSRRKGTTMKANVGGIDRWVRIIAGVTLVALAATGTIGVWGYIGIVPIATASSAGAPPTFRSASAPARPRAADGEGSQRAIGRPTRTADRPGRTGSTRHTAPDAPPPCGCGCSKKTSEQTAKNSAGFVAA